MLFDQEQTRRVTDRPQPGIVCTVTRRSFPLPGMGDGDVMKGLRSCAMTYAAPTRCR